MQEKTNIAIIGASFAGLSAYAVCKKRLPNANIKLFDQRDTFTYIPGLHECVGNTDALHKMQFNLPQAYKKDFIHAKVTKVTPDHIIHLDNQQSRHYDYAIIATGSRVNYFGNDNFAQYAYTVRRAQDIPKLNNALTTAQHVTIIGGGFTGVEVASVLAQRKLPLQIRLIHSRGRLFHRLDPSISKTSYAYLDKQGVEIILNDKATDMTESTVTLKSWKTLPSDVTILTSGIKINDEQHKPQLTFDSYTATETDHVLMCGDVATHGLYTTAHNAMVEGRRIGHIVADRWQGTNKQYKPLHNFNALAIALGTRDGILVINNKGYRLPRLTWLLKKTIEKKVLFELKHQLLLPL